MFPRRALLVCFVVCAALACKPQAATAPSSSAAAAAKPEAGAAAATTAHGPSSGAHADVCPVRVPATTVTVMNTKDGVAMYFTTLGTYVDEVRRRTKALAQAPAPQPAARPASDRDPADVAPWEILGQAGLVPMRVTTEDIPEGSRLVLVPADPDDLDTLRAYARAQGERMRLGDCPADFLKGRSKAATHASSPDTHS